MTKKTTKKMDGRENIAQLTRDIDRAWDNASIASRFAIATTLACGLVRALVPMRMTYESRHAAKTCKTQKTRAFRADALGRLDAWSVFAAEIIAELPTYSGMPGSPASRECWESLRALVDSGWMRAVDADTDIDITKMGRSDGEENDQEDDKEDDQEK